MYYSFWFMLSHGDDPKSSWCHAMFWKKAHEAQQRPSSFQSLGREGRANMQLLKSVKFEKTYDRLICRLARLVPVLCPEALLELTNFGKVASATCCDRKRCEEQSRSGRIWGSLGMPATGWTLKCGGYAEVYQRDTLQNKLVCGYLRQWIFSLWDCYILHNTHNPRCSTPLRPVECPELTGSLSALGKGGSAYWLTTYFWHFILSSLFKSFHMQLICHDIQTFGHSP